MSEKISPLVTQAYEKIKTNILNLTYPPGMTLTTTALTQELDMSRSPVRAALQMLQTEGLIVSDYYKSMMVKEITTQDIEELYQLRELLEGSAFKMIFDTGRYKEYSYRIEAIVVKMCALADHQYEWELADTSLHMEIISIFNNKKINKIYENSLSEQVRIGQYSIRNGSSIDRFNENLREMVLYMREGNYEKAYEILKADHFSLGMNHALEGRTEE